MNRSPRLLIVCILFVFGTSLAFARDYTRKNYNDDCAALAADGDILALFRDYIEHATDMAVLRKVETDWSAIDSVAALQYFRDKHEQNPASSQWAYLYGRLLSTADQVPVARKIIAGDPQYPWGYRLLLATYKSDLFDNEGRGADQEALNARLAADSAYFETWSRLDSMDGVAQATLFGYYLYSGRTQKANELFSAARKAEAGWADDDQNYNLLLAQGKYDDVRNAIAAGADEMIKSDNLKEANKESFVRSNFISALRRARAYDKAVEYVRSFDNLDSNPEWLYDLACYQALTGHPADAVASLHRAAAAGYGNAAHASGDEDLSSLRTDPGWNDVLAEMTTAHDQQRQKARDAIAASKMDKPAPEWELKDVNGNTVKLADLRGQVVVLDFWATWCGPCRMAMPVVDRYMRTQMPDSGVRVFSIDVWEQPAQKAKLFMKNKQYAMTLLFGNDDLVKAYGIRGIPFLCVIDKQGHIRYTEIGYEDSLADNLPLWVEDLLQAPRAASN